MKKPKSLLNKIGWDDFKQSAKDAFLFPILAPYNLAGAIRASKETEEPPLTLDTVAGTIAGVVPDTLLSLAQCVGYYYAAMHGPSEVLAIPIVTNLAAGYLNLTNDYTNRKK